MKKSDLLSSTSAVPALAHTLIPPIADISPTNMPRSSPALHDPGYQDVRARSADAISAAFTRPPRQKRKHGRGER